MGLIGGLDMGTYEKLKEKLKSPEGQELIKKWAEDYKKQQEEKKQIVKWMIESDEYISWLERWTVQYSQFCDDDWLYCPNDISKEDKEKVDIFYLLFNLIDEYAGRNFISNNPCDFGCYYLIKNNNVGYQIGMMAGQGVIHFCKRVEVVDECIDFKDIQVNKKLENVILIEGNLEKLACLITVIAEDNTPLDAIVSTTENTVKKILARRREK